MKMIKQTLLLAGILAAGVAGAQTKSMKNMIKVGINAGVATGDNTSANLGGNLSYQHLVTPGFGLGLATGYNHFFAKDNGDIKNNDFGVVPVAALFRVYPQKTGFYGGADLGYGFIVGNDKVASNYTTAMPDGGFYLRPEIGYHNRDWNFFIQYTKVFTGDNGKIGNQAFDTGSIGAGFSYNIPLGE
ncbi:hypothetical protein [Riemerella anatipestifer]|uniref:Outer membrane protein beta-barrel domain-containing protein n=1 Tax=Riemerella anatipestifer TaxID=34085 RepID=A0AAP3EX98_RIEAN|nr:hypothetical protein [Riemerella anatipestifer]AZZ59757.1 hypothetical protein AWB57_03400 [Riemerella anatipestifer]MBT0552075.1 hypothetical protein [Riemerella anatipestifer]MBT0554338.1 hypothetical protein [Riemerella anatipestifer]MBT0572688.1 hypothetical protein [Riemerella anatipestifer]MCE3024861.1 hypothetical protein [Riemerella anatipestifer]